MNIRIKKSNITIGLLLLIATVIFTSCLSGNGIANAGKTPCNTNIAQKAPKGAYCEVSGTKEYNLLKLTTSGAFEDISYFGEQPKNNYEYYQDGKLVVEKDTQFSLTIFQSNAWSKTVLWIDWNGNNNFKDKGEQIIIFGLSEQKNESPMTQEIQVPADALIGTTRMRLQTVDAWVNYAPCGVIANSSTKDFDIEIK